MKNKYLFLISLLLVSIIATTIQPTVASENSNPQKGTDNKYHIKIIASQWKFVAIDLTTNKEYEHRIGSFDKGAVLVLEVVSKDVQHGFSINDLNIAVSTIRPVPGEIEGAPTIVETTLPNDDVTLSGFCHIFCGLGHPDMKLKFVIGEGSFEVGKFLFWGVIAINIIIFAIVYRKIVARTNSSVIVNA